MSVGTEHGIHCYPWLWIFTTSLSSGRIPLWYCLEPDGLLLIKGYSPMVYVNETRPLLQGARLTAFELMKAGIDVTDL